MRGDNLAGPVVRDRMSEQEFQCKRKLPGVLRAHNYSSKVPAWQIEVRILQCVPGVEPELQARRLMYSPFLLQRELNVYQAGPYGIVSAGRPEGKGAGRPKAEVLVRQSGWRSWALRWDRRQHWDAQGDSR